MSYLSQRVSLIVMEAALHAHDRHAAQQAEDHLAGMALDRADREVRNRLVRKGIGCGQLIGQRAQTRTANDADLRPVLGALQKIVGDLQQRFVRVTGMG